MGYQEKIKKQKLSYDAKVCSASVCMCCDVLLEIVRNCTIIYPSIRLKNLKKLQTGIYNQDCYKNRLREIKEKETLLSNYLSSNDPCTREKCGRRKIIHIRIIRTNNTNNSIGKN